MGKDLSKKHTDLSEERESSSGSENSLTEGGEKYIGGGKKEKRRELQDIFELSRKQKRTTKGG